jgi:hypothetical protein
MTIEWLSYPEGSEADGEWTTITWSDGLQQQIPTNYSDGDGLERLADSAHELLRIQYFHIGYGGTSTYPAIWRFPDDVLVLHAYDDESFNCFFICRSKNLVECVTSWLQGEVAEQVDKSGWYSGSDPTYYFHTREIMAFGATDLLSDVKHLELELWNSKSRLLLPEDRSGMNANMVRATHISLFWDRLIEPLVDLVQDLKRLDGAIQVSGSLTTYEWQQITSWCYEGSLAQRLEVDNALRDNWNLIVRTAESLTPELEAQWARNGI